MMSMRQNPDDTSESKRPAKKNKPENPGKKEGTTSRQVFIDLDDAYGVPFSSSSVSLQDYETRASVQNLRHE